MAVVEGTLAFENLDTHEMYQGQSTGKYSVVISVDVPVYDKEGMPFTGRIGRGSKVRLLWQEGPPHPVHGTSTYLNKIKVLEVAEQDDGEEF